MAKSKKTKQVRQREQPTEKKQARQEVDPGQVSKMNPVWSIRLFDVVGPWGRELIENGGHLWEAIFPKLRNYESMTWGEIERDRQYNHAVKVEKLDKSAQKRLSELKLDDHAELFRLRLNGTQRVWGIRSWNMLQLLWWDPDHKICPSKKK